MKNKHLLVVKYLGPTNHRGARVKITSYRFNQSVTISYDYETDAKGTALKFLKKRGIKIDSFSEFGPNDSYYLMSSTFKRLK